MEGYLLQINEIKLNILEKLTISILQSYEIYKYNDVYLQM